MSKPNKNDAVQLLVPASTISRTIGCTDRYIHIMHEEGTIPGHRIGKGLVRYHLPSVMKALGIPDSIFAQPSGGANQ